MSNSRKYIEMLHLVTARESTGEVRKYTENESTNSVKILTIEAPVPWLRWVLFFLWGQSVTERGAAPFFPQPEHCALRSRPNGLVPETAPKCDDVEMASVERHVNVDDDAKQPLKHGGA